MVMKSPKPNYPWRSARQHQPTGRLLAGPRLLGLDSQTGKQRYLTRTVHGTKRDAERVRTELVAEADRGGFGDTSAVPSPSWSSAGWSI